MLPKDHATTERFTASLAAETNNAENEKLSKCRIAKMRIVKKQVQTIVQTIRTFSEENDPDIHVYFGYATCDFSGTFKSKLNSCRSAHIIPPKCQILQHLTLFDVSPISGSATTIEEKSVDLTQGSDNTQESVEYIEEKLNSGAIAEGVFVEGSDNTQELTAEGSATAFDLLDRDVEFTPSVQKTVDKLSKQRADEMAEFNLLDRDVELSPSVQKTVDRLSKQRADEIAKKRKQRADELANKGRKLFVG